MDFPSSCRLDYGFLDSLEWSEKGVSLNSFLGQFISTLPHVVKVLEGFCGDAFAGTIDSGQILILHSIHKETKLVGQNTLKSDLFIPKNFQVKVEMIPKNSTEESTSVRDLLQTFPKYFRVLDDIPSHEITSGSMFKIIRQKSYDYFECLQIANNQEEREIRLPLSLKGRFQALQDNREFFLDEVYAEEDNPIDLPVNVHFVKSSMSGISLPGINVESLYELGTVRLIGKCEMETVFASVITSEDCKTLAVFPKNLEITVKPAKSNQLYETLRQAIEETQHKTVKRIERLNKLSLYQATNPVRQFSLDELEPPALPNGKTRTRSLMETSSETTTNKKRSNSTPPLPPKKQPIAEIKSAKKHPKKPLRQAPSVPTNLMANHNTKDTEQGKDEERDCPSVASKKKRPQYSPPDIPLNASEPPLPPKEKFKPLKGNFEENRTTAQDPQLIPQDIDQSEDPDSPPIPPPRPRRRQKSLGKRDDIRKSADTNSGYEQMDWDGFGQEIEYEHMYSIVDCSSLIEKDKLENKNDGTLEEIFGDTMNKCETDSTKKMEGRLKGIENGVDGNVRGFDVNEKTQKKDKETVFANEQRPRKDSFDYENTKELKLVYPSKEKSGETVLLNDTDNQRERKGSGDYENTKELKLVPPSKEKSEETVLPSDIESQRERKGSVDYENTKELKLVPPSKEKSEETVLPSDTDEHRERKGSVDYENTKELKLIQPTKLSEEVSSLPDDITSEERSRKDSVDYENAKELKLKVPRVKIRHFQESSAEEKHAREDNNKDVHVQILQGHSDNKSSSHLRNVKDIEVCQNGSSLNFGDGDSKLGQASTSVKTPPCNGMGIEKPCFKIEDKCTSKVENVCGSDCENKIAKTKQCINDKRLRGTLLSNGKQTSELESTMKESTKVASHKSFVLAAENFPEDPSYTSMDRNTWSDDIYIEMGGGDDTYTNMTENNSFDDVYTEMSGIDDMTYTSMDGSHIDSSIYENEPSDLKEYDSDEINYEFVDLLSCTPRKMNQQSSSDPYEEVDIIQQIESHINASTDCQELSYEKMDKQVDSITPSRDRSGSDNSYEEIEASLKTDSKLLNVVLRGRSGSDNSYEDVDFDIDDCTPPTPPQRRARKRKSAAGNDVKVVDDYKDNSEKLSSSPTSGEAVTQSKEDFEDLDTLRVHMAIKDSERQMLFEKALHHKDKEQLKKTSAFSKEAYETNQQVGGKDVSTTVDEESMRYIKSRPPEPPPRKPANYLDVESTVKSKSVPFKKRTPCHYSEVIGEVKALHSSKDDDMEYTDDIELHYFQKEHMEKEKTRKEKGKQKKVSDSNIEENVSGKGAKRKEVEKDKFEKISLNEIESCSTVESKSEDDHSYEDVIQSAPKKTNSNKQIPKTQVKQDSRLPLTKSVSYNTKSVLTKPPVNKKTVIKKQSSCDPTTPKHQSHDSYTSKSSHDPIEPITSNLSRNQNEPMTSQSESHDVSKPKHDSVKPVIAKKPVRTTKPLNPPPKPKRTFASCTDDTKFTINSKDNESTVNTNIRSISSKTTTCAKDISSSSDGGKSIQTSVDQKMFRSVSQDEKGRVKPPKPLPRRKP